MAGLSPREIPRTLVRALVQSRGRVLPALFNALVRVNTRPDLADRALLGRLAEQWRRELLPDYQRLVADAEMRVETANRPVVRARFDALLEVAQRYAVIREEQTRWFTLGWPVLRRCVLRLGEALSQQVADKSSGPRGRWTRGLRLFPARRDSGGAGNLRTAYPTRGDRGRNTLCQPQYYDVRTCRILIRYWARSST
jgi:hypothetical protein